jgi:hypothetical protein
MQFERQHIIYSLRRHNYDKAETAQHLGIGVSSLYRKLEELRIPKDLQEQERGANARNPGRGSGRGPERCFVANFSSGSACWSPASSRAPRWPSTCCRTRSRRSTASTTTRWCCRRAHDLAIASPDRGCAVTVGGAPAAPSAQDSSPRRTLWRASSPPSASTRADQDRRLAAGLAFAGLKRPAPGFLDPEATPRAEREAQSRPVSEPRCGPGPTAPRVRRRRAEGVRPRYFRWLVLGLTLAALVMVNVAVFVLLRTARWCSSRWASWSTAAANWPRSTSTIA